MIGLIDLSGCATRPLKSRREIGRLVVGLCKEIKMKRFGTTLIKRFGQGELLGYSAMQFIETSSITCHFDEVKNRAFIDIFSCKYFDYKKAAAFTKKFLHAQKAVAKCFLRI